MRKCLLLLLLLIPVTVRANPITPQFTQGSMQSTTVTQVDIEETIEQEVFGGVYSKWTGENITHTSATSGGLVDSDSIFTLHTAGDPFTLEITTRAAGVVETIDIDSTIEQTSTTTSLSVFSQ